MSYESPIKKIMSDMQYQYEEDCVKVVQSYGFDVDKEELTKALLYDRNQFEKGYQQGRVDAIDECIKLVGGNVKTIVGVIFDNSIPIHDRALGRMAKNKLIEELMEQLEQLKEQNK